MLSARINNTTRRFVYARDHYACALCDSTKYLQIHHCIKRSQGGTNHPHNLITLCADCHALAHGIKLNDGWEATVEEMEQEIIEYLADYYAGCWNPRKDDSCLW